MIHTQTESDQLTDQREERRAEPTTCQHQMMRLLSCHVRTSMRNLARLSRVKSRCEMITCASLEKSNTKRRMDNYNNIRQIHHYCCHHYQQANDTSWFSYERIMMLPTTGTIISGKQVSKTASSSNSLGIISRPLGGYRSSLACRTLVTAGAAAAVAAALGIITWRALSRFQTLVIINIILPDHQWPPE